MIVPRPFRAGWIPSIAAAAGIALALAAGIWQMHRAAEKESRQERLEALRREPPLHLSSALVRPDDLLYWRVSVAGSFAPEHTVFVDNRIRAGVVGFEIVTPLRIGDSQVFVAVKRGWIAGTGRRDELPTVSTPPGAVTLEGTVVPAQRVYELSQSGSADNVWPSFTVNRMRKASGLNLQPIILQQESDLDDGLQRVWERPDSGRDRHLAYAFQWFALGIAILLTYVVLGFRRKFPAQGHS